MVVVIGAGERAATHCAWYRRAGIAVEEISGPCPDHLPAADFYDVCACDEAREPFLRLLLRTRRAAVLISTPGGHSVADVADLAQAAARRRSAMAFTGGWRFVPAFARLREFVVSGAMGVVQQVRVEIRASAERYAEVVIGALDLGLWFAGDSLPEAGVVSADGTLGFRTGAAQVEICASSADMPEGTAWSAHVRGDLAQAEAEARFRPGEPGALCSGQSLELTFGPRRRRLHLPVADPAGGELCAALAGLTTAPPWLGLCTAARLVALFTAVPAALAEVCGGTSLP